MKPAQREAIKNMFGGHCAYCGCALGDKWHIDHIEPIIRGIDLVRVDRPNQMYVIKSKMFRPENNREDNLFPACIPCNIHKSKNNVEGFRANLEGHINVLNKSNSYSIYRHAKRFGLVEENPKKIVFYFEKVKP